MVPGVTWYRRRRLQLNHILLCGCPGCRSLGQHWVDEQLQEFVAHSRRPWSLQPARISILHDELTCPETRTRYGHDLGGNKPPQPWKFTGKRAQPVHVICFPSLPVELHVFTHANRYPLMGFNVLYCLILCIAQKQPEGLEWADGFGLAARSE